MKFGLAAFVTDEGIRPEELARAAEDRGFESLLVPEHSHIPANRKTPYPGGGDLPRPYYRSLDPFAALAAAASATDRIKLGTGICAVFQRDPIHTAKEVATVDYLSNGRFLFGVGGGWLREEMRDHGTDPAVRLRVVRERIQAMKALWTQEIAEYHGEHIDFPPSYLWPKPVQRPHPPILVGGMGPTVLDRVLDYGDGWLPNLIGQPPERLHAMLRKLRDKAADAGRAPVPVTVLGAAANGEEFDRYEELGVERVLFLLPTAPGDETLARLDALAELVGKQDTHKER
ncbi:LLM class F420-dependent oxidoreductase [Amycolatopsis orientalis]|uniref:LLM class F420-dependent oxidoreductase n=1 Tax=Amycolatopsis orientalis TaxID=31958 RepID=UPI0003A7027F|nr:LLM class F420-dependent oxidoreductase [Amycolatopsis orientalis]